MARVRVAQGLVIASLILLIIYGADVASAKGEQGFLPMSAAARGMGFGGSSVALSIAAFIISLKERSHLVSILLIINGALIIVGGSMGVVGAEQVSATSYGVLGMGIVIVGMGIAKIVKR